MAGSKRYSGPVTVAGVERVASDAALLTIEAPTVAAAAQPGQFVMIRFPDLADPFLPRPFSVYDVDGDALLLLVQIVGRTSRRLADASAGEHLNLAGPLGSGFDVVEGSVRHLLVGGGMGVAPFPLLLKRLRRVEQADIQVLVGACTADGLYTLDRLAPDRQTTTTEDGTSGRTGLVTDLLAGALHGEDVRKAVYACGPEPMLEAVARLCIETGVPCQISLETVMACGTGLCHGCAVRLAGNGFARVCTDGPVFNADDLAIPWSK